MYQQPSLPTGNLHSRRPRRSSGEATGGSTVQNFSLTGQTPQALVGHEANHNYSYATGSFPANKHGGGLHTNRLQNAINYNRSRYFQFQYANEIPESSSNRMLQGIQGGHFNSMDPQQQYSVNRIYMNGGRRMTQSFKPSFNRVSQGDAFGPSNQYSFDSMLPNLPGRSDVPGYPDRYCEFDPSEDLDEEKGYRYKYNSRSARGNDEADLIGKYAKYYRTQDFQNERNKQLKDVPPSHNKNNELVSRYLKRAAKKQVRSTSISVPKYTGDYDPEVYVTGKLASRETLSQSSFIKDSANTTKQPSQEIIKESLLNKQEAAAEQKFRLEKSNFPAPSSLDNTSTETTSEKAKYKLKYTKRKKMVIASTSDKENDPSMLVKGGDDVTLGNDGDDEEEASKNKEAEVTEPTPIIQENTDDLQAPNNYKVPSAKKIIKKIRRPSVMPKSIIEKENEKKVEASNKLQSEQTNKSKVTKVDIKKQVKRVSIEKVKRTPLIGTKNEEQNKEEETEENVNLQSIAEEEEMSHLEDIVYHSGDSEKELQFADGEDDAEKTEQQNAEDELNAILAPLRAQVPDNFRLSPTLGFLPIMPVTFSWFPMSQQHKEAFQKISEQSKFPNSLRPFQRFAAT